jgi:hypothetical protein
MRKILYHYFRYYIFLCLTLLTGCGQHPPATKLTDLDNQYLETFFRHLFETTTGGYVLYGDKPLLWCPFKPIEKTIPGTAEHKDAVIFTQGLKAWKKLNIQSKNYLLISVTSTETQPFEMIFLINKKAFNNVVRNNLSLFRFKLGPQINEQNLLDNLLSPNGFSTVLKGHEALQGILFGYGVQNSLTFERGSALRKITFKASKVIPPFQYHLEPTTPEELKEQIYNYVDSQEGLGQNILDELADFSFYMPENENEITPKIPFSYHTESEESKKLLEAYKESEKTLINLQAQKNFLDQILTRLKQ